MWRYYTEVEDALKISGPVRYPWGPKRPRYPYRAHPLNAAADRIVITSAGNAEIKALRALDSQKGRNEQGALVRSEEHTSELQSLMRTSYAVFCLTKKINYQNKHTTHVLTCA